MSRLVVRELCIGRLRGLRRLRLCLAPITVLSGCCSGRTSVMEALLFLTRMGEVVSGVQLIDVLRAARGRGFTYSSLVAGGPVYLLYLLEDVGGYAVRLEPSGGGSVAFREALVAGSMELARLDGIVSMRGMRLIHVTTGSSVASGGGGLRHARPLYSSPGAADVYLEAVKAGWHRLVNSGATMRAAEAVSSALGVRFEEVLLEPGPDTKLVLEAYAAGRRVPLEDLGRNAYWLTLTMLAVEAGNADIVLLDDIDALAASRPEGLAELLAGLNERGVQVVASTASPEAAGRLVERLEGLGVEANHINMAEAVQGRSGCEACPGGREAGLRRGAS